MKIDPLGDGISSVELVGTYRTDKDIVNAARVSTGKEWDVSEFDEKDYRLLKYLLRHQHGSPFEHTFLQFRIKAPLFVHAQWVKHRIGTSINTESGRYTEIHEEFYIPTTFRKQSESNKQASTDEVIRNSDFARIIYEQSVRQAFDTYKYLLGMGAAREQARGVLPQSTYTSFVFTCNVRSLIHFLQLRTAEGAQYEIRQYANAISRLAEPAFPYTFKAISELGGFRHI